MRREKLFLCGFLFLAAASELFADDGFPALQVVPWNGHKAAASLTFDDGDPSQLDVAVPELNQRKMHGTFFLAANKITRKDEWRKILADGHEIGNQTLDHEHASELTPADEESQVVGAQHVLQKEFGVPVLTFAYPFGDVTPGLRNQVEKSHWLARGSKRQGLIIPGADPDWMELPSYGTMAILSFSTYKEWADQDLGKEAWMVWTIHELGGTPCGYQSIPQEVFGRVLDYLKLKDFWVGTLSEIGGYLWAQKILEKGTSTVSGTSKKWTWTVPASFPANVVLKVRFISRIRMDHQMEVGTIGEVWQGRQKISPDERGFYPVNFHTGQLTLHLLPK